jgi:hypothetical protein
MVTLSSSDLITVAAAVAQIVVAIGIAVRQARVPKARRRASKSNKAGAVHERSNVAWYFQNAWGFLIGIPGAITLLCTYGVSSEPSTIGSVLIMIFLSLWLAFNVLLAAAYAFATPFRPIYAKLQALSAKRDP